MSPIVQEIARALDAAGARDLTETSRAWLVGRLNEHGYVPFSQNLGGLAPAGFGEVGATAIERPWSPFAHVVERDGRPLAVFGSLHEAATALVSEARRAGATATTPAKDVAGLLPSWLPPTPLTALDDALFGPSDEAKARFQQLRADWSSFEAQGVANDPSLSKDLAEWRVFRDAWERGDITTTDLGGRLNAEIVRANRVRATLAEKASGTPVFVQDQPGNIPGIDPVDASSALKDVAKPIDDFARKNAVLNWATDPSSSPAGAGSKILGVVAGVAALGFAVSLALGFVMRPTVVVRR